MSLRTHRIRLIGLYSLCLLGLLALHPALLCSWNLNVGWVLAVGRSQGNSRSGRPEARFRRALQLQPRSGAWLGLGYVALLQEDREATDAAFGKALDINRSQPLANLQLARIRLSEGRLDEAARHYSAVGDAYGLVRLGDTLAGSQPGRAQRLYESAIAVQPTIRLPHTQMGKLFQDEGRLDEAMVQFELALNADPGYVWSWYHVAGTYLDAGRPEKCLEWIDSAKSRFPLDPELTPALQRLELRARNALADSRRKRP
jgi:tetratricopeptide (TPR) repeat protein